MKGTGGRRVNSYFPNEAKCRFFVFFYIKRPFEKYHNTLSCPSKIFCKHCFQFLLGPKSGRCGRDEKRAAHSGVGGEAIKP